MHRVGPGVSPFWAPAGTSLYFVGAPGVESFSLVTITTEPSFEISAPSIVPRRTISGGGPALPRAYDAAPDNQHLVAAAQASGEIPARPGSNSYSIGSMN